MQTWHLLLVLRQERRIASFGAFQSGVHARLLSTTIQRKQNKSTETVNEDATCTSSQRNKLKGKQRWRARQRELREQGGEVPGGDLYHTAETSDAGADSATIFKEGSDERDHKVNTSRASSSKGADHTHGSVACGDPKTSVPANLPKPSYLRPSLQDILDKKLIKKYAQKHYRKLNPGGIKLQESLKSAPFETAFSQNPYAHVLATPVREDILSRVHLPMACLLDFHVAELDAAPEAPESVSRSKGRKETDRTVQYQLLPLSLASELRPTSKSGGGRHSSSTKVDTARDEAQSLRPTGNASYLSANYDALAFISSDTKRRLIPYGLSRRMHHDIGLRRDMQPSQVKWRPDMADFVLNALRSIAAKKLGYLLRSKGARDRPGLVYEVLGQGRDLRMLHHMEDVSCVIKLTADEKDGEAMKTLVTRNTTGVEQETWRNYPFLDGVMPLSYSQSYLQSHDSSPETVPYRNINIPAYSLHALLGSNMANKLVADTVFAEGGRTGTQQESVDNEDSRPLLRRPTEYVVLTRSGGTLQAQIWLSKLQSFISDSRTLQQQ